MQQPVGEAGRSFKRVAEGVTEIKQHAIAGFALVAGNNRGLGSAAHRNGVLACKTSGRMGAGEQVAPVRVEPFEEIGVAEQSVFHHLGVAGAELALRQRVEQRGVGHHQDRLVECADQVLALPRVDCGLAADGGIDLRQERGRHLDVIDAAANDRCGKAAEIADHAAAERHDDIAAFDPGRQQIVADPFKKTEALAAFAGRHLHRG